MTNTELLDNLLGKGNYFGCGSPDDDEQLNNILDETVGGILANTVVHNLLTDDIMHDFPYLMVLKNINVKIRDIDPKELKVVMATLGLFVSGAEHAKKKMEGDDNGSKD